MPEREDVDRIARAICREKCAFLGEPPCWDKSIFPGEPWPNPDCDEPGCHALADAVLAGFPPDAPVAVPAGASGAQQARVTLLPMGTAPKGDGTSVLAKLRPDIRDRFFRGKRADRFLEISATVQPCEACGSEGRYEDGRPCQYCEGTGGELIETEYAPEDVAEMIDATPPLDAPAPTATPVDVGAGGSGAQQALRLLVAEADRNPFNPIGHVVEHVVPEARAALAALRALTERSEQP